MSSSSGPHAVSMFHGRRPPTTSPAFTSWYNGMLRHLSKLANPSVADIKSGVAPRSGSFLHMAARLCFYGSTIRLGERHDVLALVHSEEVQRIASFIFEASRFPKPAERRQIMQKFDALVEQVLEYFAQWLCSWKAVPRRDLPVNKAMELLRDSAESAPPDVRMDWSLAIFVFGHIPRFWGLPNEPDQSGSEPSSASTGNTATALEMFNIGSLAEFEGHLVADNADLMAVDYDSVSHIPLTVPAVGSGGISPPLPVTPTAVEALASIDSVSATNPAPPQLNEVLDSVEPSTRPNLVNGFIPDPDLPAFLSAFEISKFFLGNELSTLLHAVLRSKAMWKETDCPKLRDVTARKLRCLHHFSQVHEEFVKKLWGFVRHIRQWHIWGLEVQFLYDTYDLEIPPEVGIKLRKLSTFVNGFTVVAFQLLEQQASFPPPKM